MRLFYLLTTMLLASYSSAQNTFNQRYHFGFLGTVLTNVIPTDSCYYGLGIIADTLPPYNTGNVFAKFDLNGDVVQIKTLTSSVRTFETWQNSLTFLNDTTLIVAGETIDSNLNLLIILYGLSGDTLFTKKITNPFSPNFNFIQPRGGLGLAPDGGIVVSNWIDNGTGGGQSIDVYALKINEDWSIDWEFIFAPPTRDRASSLIVDGNGETILGWRTTNTNQVFENFTSQIKIAKLNPSGGPLWEYTSPLALGLRDAPRDMVLLEDGSLVIASGVGTEVELGPSTHRIWYEKLLFKLSPDGGIIWETIIPDFELDGHSFLRNIVQASDGSGFVVSGDHGEDTGTQSDLKYAIRGDISKVSNHGLLLWTRRYVGIDNDMPRHEVFDLKECPDGGFILAGESLDGTLETLPPQQAWLLKLDQHGCLVPGCHLLDDVGEDTETPLQLAIYPNPTMDYLNFQLRSSQTLKNGTFRIINANGQVMEEFEVDVRKEDTFVLPVWEWAAGAYFLQYVGEKGEVAASQKFIKH